MRRLAALILVLAACKAGAPPEQYGFVAMPGSDTVPVEKFTISIVSTGAKRGGLVMEWGTFRWTAPIVVK